MKDEENRSEEMRQQNVPLSAETMRDLKRVALYNSRTQRRQAAIYIQRGVERDMRRIAK